MAISQLFQAGAAGGAAEVIGNGPVVHNNGQLVGRPPVVARPLIVERADGLAGAQRWSLSPQSMLLGSLIGANLNSTADQAIEIAGADTYLVTRVVVTNPSGQPSIAQGGIYTAPAKAGRTIVAATQLFTGVDPDEPTKAIVIPVTLGYVLRAPLLYFALTTAQGSAMTADIYVLGDVIVAPV